MRYYYPTNDNAKLYFALANGEGEEMISDLCLPYRDFVCKSKRATRRKATVFANKRKEAKAAFFFDVPKAKAEGYSVREMLNITHSYRASNRKPTEETETEMETETEIKFRHETDIKREFDRYVKDYEMCGDDICSYDGFGYLIKVAGYEFHAKTPTDARYLIMGGEN